MSKFASTKLREIDLWDWEWVKIPEVISYEQALTFSDAWTNTEVSKMMLLECIKEWNIKDEDGNIPELNLINISRLDIKIILIISEEITKLLVNNQDKKKSPPSN